MDFLQGPVVLFKPQRRNGGKHLRDMEKRRLPSGSRWCNGRINHYKDLYSFSFTQKDR